MPFPEDDRPAIRIVTRGLAELQTSIMARALPMLGGVDRFAILTVLMAQHLRAQPGHDRPISVLALATSLARPFETVRRHVKALEAAGLCRIATAGIVLDEARLRHAPLAELSGHVHDCMVRFVEELGALGATFPARRIDVAYGTAAGLLAASDLMLAVASNNDGAHASFTDLVIFSAVLACNYRRITATRPLARRIRNETHPAPPDLLVGARASVIARTLGLAESTVRRRMTAMLDGPLVLQDQGFLVSKPWLNAEPAIAVSRASTARVRRVLANLAHAGFPFDNPRRAYLAGQAPPYAAFV